MSNPSERVIEIIILLWQLFNYSKFIENIFNSALLLQFMPNNPFFIPFKLIVFIANIFRKNQDESFPPIDFFHNYKRYLQDLVNDQIKYMRKETADVLVDFNPLSPETNFINVENVLNLPPQQLRGPRIVITTQCCLYFP